jgi:hypothetical protein
MSNRRGQQESINSERESCRSRYHIFSRWDCHKVRLGTSVFAERASIDRQLKACTCTSTSTSVNLRCWSQAGDFIGGLSCADLGCPVKVQSRRSATLLYWKNRLRDTFLFGRLGKYIGPIVTLITQVFCTSPSNMPSRQVTTNRAVIEEPNLTKRIFYQRNQETQYASRCP